MQALSKGYQLHIKSVPKGYIHYPFANSEKELDSSIQQIVFACGYSTPFTNFRSVSTTFLKLAKSKKI
jgi:hypothetical protein